MVTIALMHIGRNASCKFKGSRLKTPMLEEQVSIRVGDGITIL